MKLSYEYVEIGSSKYPRSLLDLRDPPAGLYLAGSKECLSTNTVGFVGSRKMSPYGSIVVKRVVDELNRSISIVSGFVDGVDSRSHVCALEHGMSTVAVLGYGFGYMELLAQTQMDLATRILDSSGCLVTEYPPEFKPTRWSFAKRNRLIAALSCCVVVVEAGESSGSLITAEIALKLGKKVFTIPRNLYETYSFGFCHLYSVGADTLISGRQINEYLNLQPHCPVVNESYSCSKYRAFLEYIKLSPCTLDDLVKLSKKPLGEVSLVLSELELTGLIMSSEGLYRVC